MTPPDPAEPALRAAQPHHVVRSVAVNLFARGRIGVGSIVSEGGRAGHQLISSSACVRRKLKIEMTATIRKMKTEMAAARPYCAPAPPKASR